jgi:hypothetical protein
MRIRRIIEKADNIISVSSTNASGSDKYSGRWDRTN